MSELKRVVIVCFYFPPFYPFVSFFSDNMILCVYSYVQFYSLQAARVRCTGIEISEALEKVREGDGGRK